MALHPVGNFREQQDVSSRRGGPVYRIVWSGNGSESFPDVGRLDGALCGAVFGIVWSGNGSEPFPDVGRLDGALCGAVLPEPKGVPPRRERARCDRVVLECATCEPDSRCERGEPE